MIGHDRALDLAGIALDFELGSDERAALDAHLAGCADCRRRAAGIRGDAEHVAAIRVRPLDPARGDEILGAILERSAPAAHPLRLAFVAALVALLALGAAIVGSGLLRHARDDLSDVPPALESPVPPDAADPTLAPSASPMVASEPVWVRVADEPIFDHSAMFAVAANADRYVAVGCLSTALDYPTEADCTAASWVSMDGRTWRRSDLASAGRSRPEGIISTPVGLIAWGRSESEGAVPIWRSSDGLSWERSTATFANDVGGIAWIDGTLVAYRDPAVVNEPAAASLWTSADGLAWTPVPSTGRCDGLPGRRAGQLFAIGDALLAPGLTRASTDGLWQGTVATSPDAECWTESEPIGGSVMAIAAHGSKFALVGSMDSDARAAGDPPPPMAAWVSTNGSAYAPATFSPSAPRGWLGDVVSDGERLISLGEALAGGFGYEPASWTSTDGWSWTKSASVPDATVDGLEAGDCTGGPCDLYRTKIQDLAGRAGSLVAVGLTHLATGGYRSVVWVADAATALAPVQLAVGSRAVTLTADLRVRSQPRVADDSIKYEPLLAEGTLLDVLGGPVYDTTYWWYRVAPLVRQGDTTVPLTLSGGVTEGWVAAAARDGTPWIGADREGACGAQPCSP